MTQTENQWLNKLSKEGFIDLSVHSFEAGKSFPEHKHDEYTVHIILEGELITHDKKGTNHYKHNDRFDIPAGWIHSAKCGPQGCKFIVGVKK